MLLIKDLVKVRIFKPQIERCWLLKIEQLVNLNSNTDRFWFLHNVFPPRDDRSKKTESKMFITVSFKQFVPLSVFPKDPGKPPDIL